MKFNDRTGERKEQKNGLYATIIKYTNAKEVLVRFDNGYEKVTKYIYFNKGNLVCQSRKKVFRNHEDKIGLVQMQKCGEECEIIDSIKGGKITVKFLKSGLVKETEFRLFKKGQVLNKNLRGKYAPGTEFTNKFELKYKIVKYNRKSHSFLIEFEDGMRTTTDAHYIEDANHPKMKRDKMNDFYGFTTKLAIKLNNTYWFKTDLGLITAREVLLNNA